MSRETVLSLLLAHPGEYLSGAAMSRTLGVSRAAVWKAIEALRQEGYEITSAPNRGYRLESAPDRVREGELSGHLAGCLVGSRLLCLDTIDSTNTEAKRQAMAGAPEGLVVLAEEQTGGRGRLGRSFQSPRGCGLYLTALLRPQLPPIEVVDFTAWVAVAVCDGIQAACGVRPRIKWTNDIYAGDKKLVGILIEHSYSGQTLARTIVGIGINVNQTEFDPALPNPVSMAMVAGRTFDRGEVLEAFRRHIGIRYAQLELHERETLQRDYRERMYRLGERHTFRYPDGTPTEASIEGVRPTGELLLRHADGTLREYLFKEIEFVIAGK